MAFFTENFLNNRRAELLRAVTRFQYRPQDCPGRQLCGGDHNVE